MTISNCPRCRVDLALADVPPFTMMGCGRCGGVWLDHAAVRAILSGGETRVEELASRAAAVTSSRPDPAPAALPCPICAAAMARCPVTRGNVALDTCNAHGTWFDADEVRRVRTALLPQSAPAVLHCAPPTAFASHGTWSTDDDSTDGATAVSFLAWVAFRALAAAADSGDRDGTDPSDPDW